MCLLSRPRPRSSSTSLALLVYAGYEPILISMPSPWGSSAISSLGIKTSYALDPSAKEVCGALGK